MGLIDIVLGALLVFGFYKGFKNGLFVELASLVAFFVGIFVAIKFSYIVAGVFEKNVSWSPKTIQVASFVITLSHNSISYSFISKSTIWYCEFCLFRLGKHIGRWSFWRTKNGPFNRNCTEFIPKSECKRYDCE